MMRKDGTKCTGTFMDGLLHGPGKAELKSSEVLEGLFYKDQIGIGSIDESGCGVGKIINLNGIVKEG